MEAIKTKGLLDLTDPASVGMSGPPSGGPPGPPEPGRDLEEDAATDAEMVHAEAMMEAFKSGDAESLRSSMKAFVQACMREGERGGY